MRVGYAPGRLDVSRAHQLPRAFLAGYVPGQAPAMALLVSSNVVVLTGGVAGWGRRWGAA